jgi:hypothetical protein
LVLGCRARPASRSETNVVYWVKRHITVVGKHDVNPVPASAQNIADGQQAFSSYCMVCHGLDGQNTGEPFASTIAPAVTSLASPQVQAYTDGQLKWIIENDLYPSGMPPARPGARHLLGRRYVANGLVHPSSAESRSLGEPAIYGGKGK